MKRSRLIITVVGLLALTGLAYYFYAGSTAPAGQRPLVALNAGNFAQLRDDFNGSHGMVRVFALLSPT
jgi:hypothetical protein